MPLSGHSLHDHVGSTAADTDTPIVTGGWPYGHTFTPPGANMLEEEYDEPTMLELLVVGAVLVSVLASPIVITAATARVILHRLRRR